MCGFTKKKKMIPFFLNFCFNFCRSSWLCCSPIYLQMASLSFVWFLVPFWFWRQFSNSLKAFWQNIDCKSSNVIPKSYTTPILWCPSPCTMLSLSRMMRTAFDVPHFVPKWDMTKLWSPYCCEELKIRKMTWFHDSHFVQFHNEPHLNQYAVYEVPETL